MLPVAPLPPLKTPSAPAQPDASSTQAPGVQTSTPKDAYSSQRRLPKPGNVPRGGISTQALPGAAPPEPLLKLRPMPKGYLGNFRAVFATLDHGIVQQALDAVHPLMKLNLRLDTKGKRRELILTEHQFRRLGRLAHVLTPQDHYQYELPYYAGGLHLVLSTKGVQGLDMVQDAALFLVQPMLSLERIRLLFSLSFVGDDVMPAMRPILAFCIQEQLTGAALAGIFERLSQAKDPTSLANTIYEAMRTPSVAVARRIGPLLLDDWVTVVSTIDAQLFEPHWTRFIANSVLLGLHDRLEGRPGLRPSDHAMVQAAMSLLMQCFQFNLTDRQRTVALIAGLPQDVINAQSVAMMLELLNTHGAAHRNSLLTQVMAQRPPPRSDKELIVSMALAGERAYNILHPRVRKKP